MTEATAPAPEPINVSFDIDLNTVVGELYRQDYDGEWVGDRPETLADRVAGLVAERVFQDLKQELSWQQPAREAVAKATDRAIEERIRALLQQPITPTDSYGNAKGEPTTLAEVIDARVATWLHERGSYDPYSSRSKKSNLETIIDEQVGHAFTRDVQNAIGDAKTQAMAAVQQAAASVFTETIARAAGVR